LDNRRTERLQLGLVRSLRDSAITSAIAGLVFLVAFQHAELPALWAALTCLAFFVSLSTLFASWVAHSDSDEIPAAQQPTEGDLSRRTRAFRRSQLAGIALLAVWLYAWHGLAV
jgi:hypothetical protein